MSAHSICTGRHVEIPRNVMKKYGNWWWKGVIPGIQMYEVPTPTTIYVVAVVPNNDRTLSVNRDGLYPDIEFVAVVFAKEGWGCYPKVDSVVCNTTPHDGYIQPVAHIGDCRMMERCRLYGTGFVGIHGNYPNGCMFFEDVAAIHFSLRYGRPRMILKDGWRGYPPPLTPPRGGGRLVQAGWKTTRKACALPRAQALSASPPPSRA